MNDHPYQQSVLTKARLAKLRFRVCESHGLPGIIAPVGSGEQLNTRGTSQRNPTIRRSPKSESQTSNDCSGNGKKAAILCVHRCFDQTIPPQQQTKRVTEQLGSTSLEAVCTDEATLIGGPDTLQPCSRGSKRSPDQANQLRTRFKLVAALCGHFKKGPKSRKCLLTVPPSGVCQSPAQTQLQSAKPKL